MQDTLGKKIGRRFLYTLGSALALLAVFLFCKPRSEFVLQNISLETEGHDATAVVIAKWTGEDGDQNAHIRRGPGRASGVASAARLVVASDRAARVDTNSRPVSEGYYVDYVFQTQGLLLTEGTLKVSANDFHKVNIGAAVPAIYHPGNPTVSRLIDYSKAAVDHGPGAELFLAALAAVTAVYLLGYGWWLSRGVASEGTLDPERQSEARPVSAPVPRAVASVTQTAAGSRSVRTSAPARRQPGFGQRARA